MFFQESFCLFFAVDASLQLYLVRKNSSVSQKMDTITWFQAYMKRYLTQNLFDNAK